MFTLGNQKGLIHVAQVKPKVTAVILREEEHENLGYSVVLMNTAAPVTKH